MSSATGLSAAFDSLAERYDSMWSHTANGRHQREAVWRCIDPLFRPGDRILDLGCGTGEDALHLKARGVHVIGIDASLQMVCCARARGVDAHQRSIEDLRRLDVRCDGAFSNFGALNCVEHLDEVAQWIASLIRPGGFAAICILGKCCAWEMLHFLGQREPRRAFRRFASGGIRSSLGITVYYPKSAEVIAAFRPHFNLVRWGGVGLFVPPSYVPSLSDNATNTLATMDRHLTCVPLLRAFADHRIFIFRRI